MVHRGDRRTFCTRLFYILGKPLEVAQFGFIRHLHGRLHQHISGNNHSLVLSDFLRLHLLQDRIDPDFVHVGLGLWGASDTKTSQPEEDQFQEFGSDSIPSGGLGLFTHDRDIHTLFERVFLQMKPDGMFIFEFEPVPDENNKLLNHKGWWGDWIKGPDNIVIAWGKKNKL